MNAKLILGLALALSGGWLGCSSVTEPPPNVKVVGDSRPPEEDPGDNRGQPAGGVQLFVRFDNDSYDIGQPIIATVIFQNVTNKAISAPLDIPRFDTEMIVTGGKGRPLAPKEPEGLTDFEKRLRQTVQSAKFRTIMPGAQEKYQVQLNDWFDLTGPGTYEVAIHYRTVANDSQIIDVHSGKAKITVTIPPKAPIFSRDSRDKDKSLKSSD